MKPTGSSLSSKKPGTGLDSEPFHLIYIFQTCFSDIHFMSTRESILEISMIISTCANLKHM
jgi:hypothetical protein